MIVNVDRVGRVVLPKLLREKLGLENGGQVEITLDGATIRISVPCKTRREFNIIDGWPVLSTESGIRLTDADVRVLRDEQR